MGQQFGSSQSPQARPTQSGAWGKAGDGLRVLAGLIILLPCLALIGIDLYYGSINDQVPASLVVAVFLSIVAYLGGVRRLTRRR